MFWESHFKWKTASWVETCDFLPFWVSCFGKNGMWSVVTLNILDQAKGHIPDLAQKLITLHRTTLQTLTHMTVFLFQANE